MKEIFINLTKYLKQSIVFISLRKTIRLFYLPFYYIIYLVNHVYINWISSPLETDVTTTKKSNKTNYYYYYQKKKWLFFRFNKFFLLLDLIYSWSLSLPFNKLNSNNFNFRVKSRLKQVNWSFYNDLHNSNNSFFNYYFIHYLSGLRYVWKGLKYWILGLVLGLTTFYYLTYIRLLPFNKVIFEWLLITMFLYWLLSGFVFFIKKYQYSKFTSVIQRFWKRTYIIFWSIESGVFIVFFYLTLNASEEPVYMYDQAKLFKTHLFSWRLFLVKLVPVITITILGYFLLLNLKWTTFSKQVPVLLTITLLLIYIFWLEFYQFFHIISYYGNLTWSFDSDEFLWNLDSEFKRTRIANNTVTICLLAKFWHLVFIFVFWIFFMLRINEIGRMRFALLGANLQNFIILYIMSWLYMYPWFKFLVKPQLQTQYYWFFFNARRLGIRIFFNDLKLFFISLSDSLSFSTLGHFNNGLFYYWLESSTELGLLQYKKHIVRDYVINVLNLNTHNNAVSLTSYI